MTELFLKMVNMSISAEWLVLVVLAFRVIFRKAPKWVNVLLWGIVGIRLICPFSLESTWSLIPSAQTIPYGMMLDTTPEINSGISVVNHSVNFIIRNSNTPGNGDSVNPLQIRFALYAVIWAVGILGFMIYAVVSYYRLYLRVRTAVRIYDNIFQSGYINSPFVMGIMKPKIYLPFKMENQNVKHVIAHEQAHIFRRDYWWKALGFLLLTVYWFNPLMWLAYMMLCRDIEFACDEKVIKDLENEEKADYSQALLMCSAGRRAVLSCPLAFGEVGVKKRVKSIMNYKKPSFWVVSAAIMIGFIVAVCFLTDPKQDNFDIKVVVPAGSQKMFVYSHEEISPIKNHVVITAGENLGDTEVILKPVKEELEIYGPTYLTPGMPVRIKTEKGEWFKIGLNLENSTDEEMTVYVNIENVEVRIE